MSVHWHRRVFDVPVRCHGWAGNDSFTKDPADVTCRHCLRVCDSCHLPRPDVRPVGRDAAGEADAPDLCGECRERVSR